MGITKNICTSFYQDLNTDRDATEQLSFLICILIMKSNWYLLPVLCKPYKYYLNKISNNSIKIVI